MNFKQNIEKNRLKIKELPERKIGEKKSKIGSSLYVCLAYYNILKIMFTQVAT